VLPIAVEVLTGWFAEHFPEVAGPHFGELIEALIRLTLSHLIQPTHSVDDTLAQLGRITELVVPAVLGTGLASG
jgi:hypothetical protein